MRVAVAGGTGLTGALVVSELAASGHEPVVLSRTAGVDLLAGAGLAAALAGVEAVIDTTNVHTRSPRTSIAFFGGVTANLLAAEQAAGVAHHVALSIVGIDRVDIGYYHGKRRQEELIRAGGIPSTILRATQFHEFAGQVLRQAALGPVSIVPRMRTQPIAAREVAAQLVSAALTAPAEELIELAGPREEQMTDLSRRLVRAGRHRRLVLGLRLPGAGGRAMASGGLLPTGPGPRGVTSFTEWLAGADAEAWRVSREAELAGAFSDSRPMLIRVAYAVLGSRAEAEDVVAECWSSLVAADGREAIRDVRAWCTLAVSRRALDALRSARVQREQYVGPWLPEPTLGQLRRDVRDASSPAADPADRVTLDETVSYALLVVLETLTPAERTAWVLHDLFGMEFAAVGEVVGRSESAVRQLASRARAHVAAGTPRVPVTPEQHRATTEAFARACAEGDLDALLALLDPDVTLLADGGGQATAARIPVVGAAKVALFVTRITAQMGEQTRAELVDVNGRTGILIREDARTVTVLSLTVDGDRITGLAALRNPEKLARLRTE